MHLSGIMDSFFSGNGMRLKFCLIINIKRSQDGVKDLTTSQFLMTCIIQHAINAAFLLNGSRKVKRMKESIRFFSFFFFFLFFVFLILWEEDKVGWKGGKYACETASYQLYPYRGIALSPCQGLHRSRAHPNFYLTTRFSRNLLPKWEHREACLMVNTVLFYYTNQINFMYSFNS